MGNNIDVCSKDEIDDIYKRYHGENNESIVQLGLRTWQGFVSQLIKPTPHQYNKYDLIKGFEDYFELQIFNVTSKSRGGTYLQGAFWKKRLKEPIQTPINTTIASTTANNNNDNMDKNLDNNDNITLNYKNSSLSINEIPIYHNNLSIKKKELVIIYLHTNKRSLKDATELFDLCINLNCHLISFDFPGDYLDIFYNLNNFFFFILYILNLSIFLQAMVNQVEL
jgi:hypothetical protein